MNSPGEQIRNEIAQYGAIPFARFMELALYCPLCGYYEKKTDTPGRRGDFFTSVSVGSLFGELLAFQFAEWLMALPLAAGRRQIVEAGAHDGRLAKDVLTWLCLRRPALFEATQYCIIEPSARRREWQRESLAEFAPRLRWFANLGALAENSPVASPHRQSPGVCGMIFSNELLDAMPVQRLGWDSKRRRWFEWGVMLEEDRFVWTRLHGANPDFKGLAPPAALDCLPDGFTMEGSTQAARWWTEAARLLRCGRLLTLDYGLDFEELISPQRASGTLRAYHRHRLVGDVLANPGEQDITAHVNFTTLRVIGEREGLRTEAACSQAEFLTRIVQRAWQSGGDFEPWTSERTRQFQTLTHPEHLGRAFRVLLQSRNLG